TPRPLPPPRAACARPHREAHVACGSRTDARALGRAGAAATRRAVSRHALSAGWRWLRPASAAQPAGPASAGSRSAALVAFALLACGLGFGAPLAQRRGGVVRRARFGQLWIPGGGHFASVAHDHVRDRDE